MATASLQKHAVRVNSIEKISPKILRIITEKPPGFKFKPGQAVSVSHHKYVLKNPFTFTSSPSDAFLELTLSLKNNAYSEIYTFKPNDELEFSSIINTLDYRGEGVFIAS